MHAPPPQVLVRDRRRRRRRAEEACATGCSRRSGATSRPGSTPRRRRSRRSGAAPTRAAGRAPARPPVPRRRSGRRGATSAPPSAGTAESAYPGPRAGTALEREHRLRRPARAGADRDHGRMLVGGTGVPSGSRRTSVASAASSSSCRRAEQRSRRRRRRGSAGRSCSTVTIAGGTARRGCPSSAISPTYRHRPRHGKRLRTSSASTAGTVTGGRLAPARAGVASEADRATARPAAGGRRPPAAPPPAGARRCAAGSACWPAMRSASSGCSGSTRQTSAGTTRTSPETVRPRSSSTGRPSAGPSCDGPSSERTSPLAESRSSQTATPGGRRPVRRRTRSRRARRPRSTPLQRRRRPTRSAPRRRCRRARTRDAARRPCAAPAGRGRRRPRWSRTRSSRDASPATVADLHLAADADDIDGRWRTGCGRRPRPSRRAPAPSEPVQTMLPAAVASSAVGALRQPHGDTVSGRRKRNSPTASQLTVSTSPSPRRSHVTSPVDVVGVLAAAERDRRECRPARSRSRRRRAGTRRSRRTGPVTVKVWSCMVVPPVSALGPALHATAAGAPAAYSPRSPTAAATARTSQVFSDEPERAAASSACDFSRSGRRRVMRAAAPSSSGSAGSAAGVGPGDVHELRLAGGQSELDGAVGHLRVELDGGLAEQVEQPRAQRALERGGDPLAGLGRRRRRPAGRSPRGRPAGA